MAGSLAGEGALDTVVYTSCRTITACSRAGELTRAIQWIHVADDFTRRYGSPHLYAVCRTHHGSVLFATGRWEQAEDELRAALRRASRRSRRRSWRTSPSCGSRRGGSRTRSVCWRTSTTGWSRRAAIAELRLVRGACDLAALMLTRRLREVTEDCSERGALLERLFEAELGRSARTRQMQVAHQLADLAARLRCDMVSARAERALGRALAATGDGQGARAHLEAALATFNRLEMAFEAGRVRVLPAEAVGDADRESAVAEARSACATFERLGAAREADRAAALLRSLGVNAARGGSIGVDVLTRREREVLVLVGEGLSNRQIAERLFLSRKRVEPMSTTCCRSWA